MLERDISQAARASAGTATASRAGFPQSRGLLLRHPAPACYQVPPIMRRSGRCLDRAFVGHTRFGGTS